MEAKATDKVTLHANLPSGFAVFDPDANSDGSVDASESDGVISEAEESNFMDQSLSGGSVTVRDANGQAGEPAAALGEDRRRGVEPLLPEQQRRGRDRVDQGRHVHVRRRPAN